MLIGHHAWENNDSSSFNPIIMEAFAESRASKFGHANTPAFNAILTLKPLQRNHAMSNAVQLHIMALGRFVIQQQDCALAIEEVMLQRENLAPVAERILSHQA